MAQLNDLIESVVSISRTQKPSSKPWCIPRPPGLRKFDFLNLHQRSGHSFIHIPMNADIKVKELCVSTIKSPVIRNFTSCVPIENRFLPNNSFRKDDRTGEPGANRWYEGWVNLETKTPRESRFQDFLQRSQFLGALQRPRDH